MEVAELALDIEQHVDIDCPIDKAFTGMLEQISTKMKYPDGRSMNFKIEARPGGGTLTALSRSPLRAEPLPCAPLRESLRSGKRHDSSPFPVLS